MIGYIYKITNPTGRVYIGQTTRPIEERWGDYRRLHIKSQKLIYNSIKKYGVEAHKFEIILRLQDSSNIDNIETFFIEFFNSYNPENPLYGMNLTKYSKTPMRGRKHTPETCKKISLKHKGKITSKDLLERMTAIVRKPVLQYDLHNNFIKGWSSLSVAARELNLLAQNIGKCCSGKMRSSGGFVWKYKIESDDLKLKHDQASIERLYRNFVKFRPVIQYDSSMNFVNKFSSIMEASKKTNIYASSINRSCNQGYKAKKFIFKYDNILSFEEFSYKHQISPR